MRGRVRTGRGGGCLGRPTRWRGLERLKGGRGK